MRNVGKFLILSPQQRLHIDENAFYSHFSCSQIIRFSPIVSLPLLFYFSSYLFLILFTYFSTYMFLCSLKNLLKYVESEELLQLSPILCYRYNFICIDLDIDINIDTYIFSS